MNQSEYDKLRPQNNDTVLVTNRDVRIDSLFIPQGVFLTPVSKNRKHVTCRNFDDFGGLTFEVRFPMEVISIQYTTSLSLIRSAEYRALQVRKQNRAKQIASSRIRVDSSYPMDAMVRRHGSYLTMNNQLTAGTGLYYIRFWNWNPHYLGSETSDAYVDGVVSIIVPSSWGKYNRNALRLVHEDDKLTVKRKYVTHLRPWSSGYVEYHPNTERIFFNPNDEL